MTFSDGSKISGVFDKATSTIKADPNTAVDSENNPIPYLGADGKIHNLGGVRHFADTYQGTQDYNNFLKQAASMNVPIQFSGSGSGSGSSNGGVVGWVCVEQGDGDEKVFTCTQG